jgi:hypothetical protein
MCTWNAASTPPRTWSRRRKAVLSERELLRAMFDVGYCPPKTLPGE